MQRSTVKTILVICHWFLCRHYPFSNPNICIFSCSHIVNTFIVIVVFMDTISPHKWLFIGAKHCFIAVLCCTAAIFPRIAFFAVISCLALSTKKPVVLSYNFCWFSLALVCDSASTDFFHGVSFSLSVICIFCNIVYSFPISKESCNTVLIWFSFPACFSASASGILSFPSHFHYH